MILYGPGAPKNKLAGTVTCTGAKSDIMKEYTCSVFVKGRSTCTRTESQLKNAYYENISTCSQTCGQVIWGSDGCGIKVDHRVCCPSNFRKRDYLLSIDGFNSSTLVM